MKPKSCKAKGRMFQQQIRNMLREVAKDMHLGLQDDDIESREMGQKGVDIRLSPAAKAALDICVECKKVESINVAGVFKKHYEGYCEKDPSSLKVLFHSKNRGQALATVRVEDFMGLLRDRLFLKQLVGKQMSEADARLMKALEDIPT
jgi:hypothetical protein